MPSRQPGRLFLLIMKYILILLALTVAVGAKAQTDLQHTPEGALYKVFTHNTGNKIKTDDVITFQFIQKTDKDSVLFSTYAAGHPVQAQVKASTNVGDLMEIFPMLTLKDSAFIRVPTDSIFKGHEDQRPLFFPKGSYLNFTLKIERIQSLNEAIAERNAAIEKVKTDEAAGAAAYIAAHKMVLTTTASGLKYVITKPSTKLKPQVGDTLLVNYAGRTLNDKLFDTSIEAIAKASGLQQPGRTYEPLEVVVGTTPLIAGWNEALLLLNEGAKATLVIPSSLGYGQQGQGEDIKPFSTLVFDIELVKLKPAKHIKATPVASSKPMLKKAAAKKPATAVKKKVS
jgi:FKBP-type peptidyl-prolyl cis-trans isomerase FkpA